MQRNIKVSGLTSTFQVCIVHFLVFWGPGKFRLRKETSLHRGRQSTRKQGATYSYRHACIILGKGTLSHRTKEISSKAFSLVGLSVSVLPVILNVFNTFDKWDRWHWKCFSWIWRASFSSTCFHVLQSWKWKSRLIWESRRWRWGC